MNTVNFTTAELKEFANYTISILQTQKNIMWSWGAKGFGFLTRQNKKSIRFSVNGFLHKGYVFISIDEGKDLFEIILTDKKGNVKKHETEIYVEDLVNRIDFLVEKGEMTENQYSKKANAFLSKVLTKL